MEAELRSMRKRPFRASVSGKGGTGKSTVTALLLKVLLERGGDDSILIVDGDPATNLPELLGVKLVRTVGDVVEEFRKRMKAQEIPADIWKEAWLEYMIIRDCLVELEAFDLLAMGRGEGEGCYCFVNSMLVEIVGKLINNYTVVLMDMEAGLEHLSRRTDRHVKTLLVVVDPSIMSLRTAERIRSVAEEVKLGFEEFFVVGNKMPNSKAPELASWARRTGYELAGIIPYDPLIDEFSSSGVPLLKLPSTSEALRAAREIALAVGLTD